MTFSIRDTHGQFYGYDNVDGYLGKIQQILGLKKELIGILQEASFEEVQFLFELRGNEFLVEENLQVDYTNLPRTGRSVLEVVLSELRFHLPLEINLFLIDFYVKHADQALATEMNPLHVIARNCFSHFQLKCIEIMDALIERDPRYLLGRLKIVRMTPVEIVVRTSYDIQLLRSMVMKQQECFGWHAEDKAQLLFHANWLTGSGDKEIAYQTREIMEFVQKIEVR